MRYSQEFIQQGTNSRSKIVEEENGKFTLYLGIQDNGHETTFITCDKWIDALHKLATLRPKSRVVKEC